MTDEVGRIPVRGQVAPRVYFIRSGDSGPIKIGFAVNPYGRLHNLQAGNPEPLTYLGDIDGDREVERAWHKRFRYLHVRGEWHRPAVILLDAIADALADQALLDCRRLQAAAQATALA